MRRSWRSRGASAVALALLLLAPGFAPSDVLRDASAEAGTVEWFGPSLFGRVDLGWNLRIPITVRNAANYALVNPPLRVEVDLADALTKAGWPGVARGSRTLIQSFTFDPASLRLVEVTGTAIKEFDVSKGVPQRFEIPARFDPVLFEGKARAAFDVRSNPVGTIAFVVPGVLQAGQERTFFLYLDAEENNVKAPPDYRTFRSNERGFRTRQFEGLLESAFWSGRGTTFYGYDPGSQGANRIEVIGLYPETRVTVYTYTSAGKIRKDESAVFPNPFDVPPLTVVPYSVSQGFFKVEATRPVLVALRGGQQGGILYYPSTDGRLLGSDFLVVSYHAKLTLVNPQPERSPDVGISGPGVEDRVKLAGQTKVVAGLRPGGLYRVRSEDGSPFLVVGSSEHSRAYRAHVPAITGSPVGDLFYAPLPEAAPQFVVWSHEEGGAARLVDLDGVRIMPPSSPQQFFAGGPNATWGSAVDPAALPDGLLAWESVPDARIRGGGPANLSLSVGSAARHYAGPFGGVFGEAFFVEGPVTMFGFYNDTLVNVTGYASGGGQPTGFHQFFLNRDEIRPAVGEASPLGAAGLLGIRATKPVTVVPTIPQRCGSGPCPYAAYLAGLDPPPSATVGAAEIRGYLVDLESLDLPTDPIVKTVAPNGTVVYKMQVTNRGRWIAGANLPDTIRVNATTPADWTVALDKENFRLDSFQAEEFSVTVTPPPTAGVGTRQEVPVTATSLSNPRIQDTLRTITLVVANYDVGLWLFQENGPRTEERSVEASEETVFDLVLKNLGSVRDTFTVAAGAPSEGWAGALADAAGNALAPRATLDAGQTMRLKYKVSAPPPGSSSLNTVEVLATSTSSAQASSRVILTTRINPNATLILASEEPARKGMPDEALAFNVTLVNKGDSFVSIRFNLTDSLPDAWADPKLLLVTDRGESELPDNELDGVAPNTAERPLRLKVRTGLPPEARTEDLGQIRLFAEIVALGRGGSSDFILLTAGVAARHNLTHDEPEEIELTPGTPTTLPLVLVNRGNGAESVRLRLASAPRGIAVTTPETIEIRIGEERPVEVVLTPEDGQAAGVYRIVLNATFSDNAKASIPLDVTVRRVVRVEITGLGAIEGSPGRTEQVPLTVRNNGNVEETFLLLADAGPGVGAVFEPERLALAPGTAGDALLLVTPAASLGEGSRALTATVKAATGEIAGRAEAPLVLRKPDLYLGKVRGTDLRSLDRGGLFTVAAEVGNQGNTAARDVAVRLTVDGRVVDNLTIGVLQPGKSVVMTLKWIVEDPEADVLIVVDGANSVQELDETNNAAEVERERTPGFSFPGLLAAFAVACAAARGIGRMRGYRGR